ncbi:MAG: glycine zipper domain-containing protein [Chthoniobacter sp.]|uniref:glycine zipper domain-containing protein n=1 Tax=Chthoniobacter sp. TaxID=2510640 RepID=UPI0032AB3A71
MNKLVPFISLTLLASFALTGCDTPGESALLGAATGAVIGGSLHGRGDQALVGAAIGAGSGYLIGKAVQHERRRAYEDGYYDGRPGDRDYRDDRTRYPVGRLTHRDGFVVSPYSPYNRIDVRGIPRGAQVEDPSTGRIFINP